MINVTYDNSWIKEENKILVNAMVIVEVHRIIASVMDYDQPFRLEKFQISNFVYRKVSADWTL